MLPVGLAPGSFPSITRWTPANIAGLVFWKQNVPLPYPYFLVNPKPMTDGPKTICFIFTLTSLPTTGTFYSLGQLFSSTPLGCEIFLSNIGTPYLPYSFACDTLYTTAVGNTTPLSTNRISLILIYNGGPTGNPTSYTLYLNGSSVSLAVSGAIGINVPYTSSIGGRSNTTAITHGQIPQAFAYNSAISGSDLTQLIAWMSTH